jgi:hypothetical protein
VSKQHVAFAKKILDLSKAIHHKQNEWEKEEPISSLRRKEIIFISTGTAHQEVGGAKQIIQFN